MRWMELALGCSGVDVGIAFGLALALFSLTLSRVVLIECNDCSVWLRHRAWKWPHHLVALLLALPPKVLPVLPYCRSCSTGAWCQIRVLTSLLHVLCGLWSVVSIVHVVRCA